MGSDIDPAGSGGPALRRLNLYCGTQPRPGWINVDLHPSDGVDCVGDICEGLPIESASIDYAVASHVLQDFVWPNVFIALAELRRLLKPDGVLRLSVPDVDRAIDAYRRGDGGYFRVPDADALSPGAKFVTQVIWYGSARTPFNFDFAREALERSGFDRVRRVEHRRTLSRFAGITELDDHGIESLFVEASPSAAP